MGLYLCVFASAATDDEIEGVEVDAPSRVEAGCRGDGEGP
jgi:hypothetical protein